MGAYTTIENTHLHSSATSSDYFCYLFCSEIDYLQQRKRLLIEQELDKHPHKYRRRTRHVEDIE